MNCMKLDALREIARLATREALREYSVPDIVWGEVVLGVQFDGGYRIFELYVPGGKPEDAWVISQARVHSVTGECEVTVLGLEKKKA